MDTRLIDLHCDTVGRITNEGPVPKGKAAPEHWGLDSEALHLCIKRRPKSIRLCQAAAIFISDKLRGKDAQAYFDKAYAVYLRELAAHGDAVAGLRDLRDIEKRLAEKPIVFFLTVEGGAALGGDIGWVDKLHDCGVKMMTLTWNGENELCGGAVSGGGFKPFGRRGGARMEALGMAGDVSHLSDEGFWELCDFATKPFCASHSNARSVCGHPRNLTDDMFREIVRRGGVVGLNYYEKFIVEGGNTASIEDLARHAHRFLELGGEDTVALGSDFDGSDVPAYLSGIEKLDALKDGLIRTGIPEGVADKILFTNASRYLASLHKEN